MPEELFGSKISRRKSRDSFVTVLMINSCRRLEATNDNITMERNIQARRFSFSLFFQSIFINFPIFPVAWEKLYPVIIFHF